MSSAETFAPAMANSLALGGSHEGHAKDLFVVMGVAYFGTAT